MGSIRNKIKILGEFILKFKSLVNWTIKSFPRKDSFGLIGKYTIFANPSNIGYPRGVFIHDQVNVRYGLTVINARTEKVVIKKYCVIAPFCTIITNSHRAVLGHPITLTSEAHVKDKSGDVIINEDVWIGAHSTILCNVNIGRGAIVGACALVTRDVPPYAVVTGIPARVVGVKFSKTGIIEHEKHLYSQNERLTFQQIDDLFEKYYSNDVKIFGDEDSLTLEELKALERVKEFRSK